jgi:hypothetical protein
LDLALDGNVRCLYDRVKAISQKALVRMLERDDVKRARLEFNQLLGELNSKSLEHRAGLELCRSQQQALERAMSYQRASPARQHELESMKPALAIYEQQLAWMDSILSKRVLLFVQLIRGWSSFFHSEYPTIERSLIVQLTRNRATLLPIRRGLHATRSASIDGVAIVAKRFCS